MKHAFDKEIIERIKNGKIDYFSVIVERYMSKMHQYIKSRLFQKMDADDLTQNTFISFYKSISRFDETKPVLPYLYQIAKNELKMYFRAHKQTARLNENIEIKDENMNFFRDDYSMALDMLTQEQKLILGLVYDGYSYREIADKMGRPINTIRTIIHRSRLLVKEKYNEKT